VRFTAGGVLEMCQHLVTWDDRVEVLEPVALRQHLAGWARGVAEHHSQTPVTGETEA